MSDSIQIDQLISFLEKSPEYREKLANLFYPSEFAKKDELTRILEEMEKNRIDANKRFDDVNKRFDDVNKRFDEVRIETNKRFDDVNKRFDEARIETDKKFDDMQKQMDYKFDKVFSRFDELSMSLGHDFEEFNSLWLQEYLIVQGFPKIKIVKRTFYDKNYFVFPDNKDIEIDLFNETPLIIGEVTAITKSIGKINIFIKKIAFIERLYEQKAQTRLFITYAFKTDIREEALELLKKNNIKVFTLRQRGIEDLNY